MQLSTPPFLRHFLCLAWQSIRQSESHSAASNSLRPHGPYSPWNSPGQNTGVGSYFILQGIFLTQESNPGLLHCRWILYQMSHHSLLDLTSLSSPTCWLLLIHTPPECARPILSSPLLSYISSRNFIALKTICTKQFSNVFILAQKYISFEISAHVPKWLLDIIT